MGNVIRVNVTVDATISNALSKQTHKHKSLDTDL